jgi:ATP-binding cassette subfamily B protein/subfamily B ATP-binding cassette protein MsbA
MITTLGTAIVLAAGGLLVLDGSLTLGSLLVFLAYLGTLSSAANGLMGVYGGLRESAASLRRVVEVLEVVDEVQDPARPVELQGTRTDGRVVLDGVTVEYEPGRPVLVDVDLSAGPGQTVALMGSTGAGKTTLVSLIPRFLDPVRGRVLVDGIDVRRLRLAELRRQVALVRQDPLLLPVSIADNIAYGRPGASRDDIDFAATAANADEFIRDLPQGYDTVLGERGATLSGGERQRIAIARALLKDAPILILDEPTSALDVDTEAQLIEALQRLMRGRTTFLITHRLSAVRAADHIVVIENGHIVEAGSHDELVAADGRYRHYHNLQTRTPAGTP